MYSPLVYAYIGDAYYELLVRKYLIEKGICKVGELQKESVKYVSAKMQAKFVNELISSEFFNEEELSIIRMGRNAKSHRGPKGLSVITYKMATAFENLIGKYYIEGNLERIDEIFLEIIGE